MIARRAGSMVVALGIAGVLTGGAMTLGAGQQPADAGKPAPAAWTEVKWPFPLDQWGVGRAFRCRAADCGADVDLYLRAKLGFCNCATGVSDDAELDRVGDLRSEEHTSELQSLRHLVCRLLLEKKKQNHDSKVYRCH